MKLGKQGGSSTPTKSELENRIEQIDEILGVLQEIRDVAIGELEQALVKAKEV